jgi:hypothetical protein
VRNTLQIEFNGNQIDNRIVEIIDQQGKVVQIFNVQKGQASLDVSSLKAGIYICREQNNLEVSTIKFIKY